MTERRGRGRPLSEENAPGDDVNRDDDLRDLRGEGKEKECAKAAAATATAPKKYVPHHMRTAGPNKSVPPRMRRKLAAAGGGDGDGGNGAAAAAATDKQVPPNDSPKKPRQKQVSSDDDPHDLRRRFVETQASTFDAALREIRNGEKESCWLWFVLPTAPYVVDGIERGSSINRHFALRGDDAARAFLELPPQEVTISPIFEFDVDSTWTTTEEGEASRTTTVDLRKNYLRMAEEIRTQLESRGGTLERLFGCVDGPKARSSLELFQRMASGMNDREVSAVCGKILELEGGEGSYSGGRYSLAKFLRGRTRRPSV